MVGKTIGKYRIVDQLGKGGMGAVYRAVDETLDREVAVKVLHPGLQDEAVMKRFRAEATTLAKLNHPEIATIFEIYRADTDFLMVMELVKGETLDQLSARSGQLPPERAAYLLAQVLGALGHAHQAGIVHRDLKPANIMVTETGGIKIMDFGIARVAGAEHLTSDGLMMGTPAYMSPEQVMAQDVDGRADLYSCGVVFYRLLTGTLPFQADTPIAMVQKQLSDMPTPAHMHRGDLPAWCYGILDRSLAKSPADRFQNAEEFRAALLAGMGGAADEHTSAYAAARLPAGTPLPAPMPTPVKAAAVKAAAAPKPQAPPDGTTIVLRRNHFAIGGALLAIVAAGVVVLAYLALRRAQAPAAPVAVAASVSTSSPTPTPTPIPTPSPDIKQPAVVTASLPAPTPSSAPKAVAAKPTPAAKDVKAAATALPPFVFESKAVVVDGGKNREHDATTSLADGKITVTEKNHRVIAAIPYAAIVGMSESNSKQPMWDSPKGPAEMMKVEAGAFGFLKGGRNWLALRTKDTSVVLRVSDESLRKVIAALEERTKRKVARVRG